MTQNLQASQLGPESFKDRFDVSRETMELLGRYVNLLIKWNRAINLVSGATITEIWHRHIFDSAQLLTHVNADKQTTWLDIGSGGGLPGLVIAIMGKAFETPGQVKLVESDGRKCAFLRTVARELDLSTEIIEGRIENLSPVGADVISARAFSSLPNLLEMAKCHGAEQVNCLFLKGQNYEVELTQAKESWHINVETIPSMTDSSASILKVKDISRASEQ